MDTHETNEATEQPGSPDEAPVEAPSWAGPPLWLKALRAALAAVIVGGAWFGAQALINTRPEARRRPPQQNAALVSVMEVTPQRHQIEVEASGRVIPSREVVLQPQVQGELVALGPRVEVGGLLTEGELVARIDPRSYQLAVAQARAALVRGQATMKLEQGQQDVARREYELIALDAAQANPELILRKPQMDSARATVEGARAALQQAALELSRTELRAPFNAAVRARHVSPGSRVTPATPLATLVGTDRWWVEVTVPTDRLRWIIAPDADGQGGSKARVRDEPLWGAGVWREGRVVRVAAELEEAGRMARLRVGIEDPMGLADADRPGLLLGSWVQVTLEGRALEGAVRLEPQLLRDGDQVWVMTPEGTLDIRPVTVAYRGRQEVYITQGLKAGERVVTSDIVGPTRGMALRTGDEPRPEERPAGEGR